MRNALIVLASLLVAAPAFAGGYAVGTHDARATALGLSLVADTDDASSIYFNPAGIVAGGQQLQVRLGDSIIIPVFTATPAGTTDTQTAKPNPVPPPHAYIVYGFSDDAAIGVGLYVPYGMDLEWDSKWVGRELATYSSLKNYFINPEVAYKLFGRLRIGAGVQIVRSTVELAKHINLVDQEAMVQMGAGAWGVGGNAGIQVELLQKDQGLGVLSFGAMYRSPVSLNFKGAAHFSGLDPDGKPTDVPNEFSGILKDQEVKTSVTLPQTFSLGLAYNNDFGDVGLRFGISTQYTGWQAFHDLTLQFEDPALSQTIYKRAHHTWDFAAGLEIGISKTWFVRVGFNYDPTPFPQDAMTPDLPDGDRIELALGAGLRYEGLALDLGYMAVLVQNFDSTYAYFPATYGGTVHVIGLTLGYAFRL